VSYDADNHDFMVRLREQKIASMVKEIPPTEIYGDTTGDVLVLGWGSTFGAIRTAVESLRQEKLSVSHAHIRWMNPLPPDLGEILLKYQKVLIPEVNLGQLSRLVRSEYLIDAEGLNLVRGRPFKESYVAEKIREML
jgi:2-oxoglutarate ferredoxin oxidoreductase subunit alpha